MSKIKCEGCFVSINKPKLELKCLGYGRHEWVEKPEVVTVSLKYLLKQGYTVGTLERKNYE